MLREVKGLHGATIHALDGEIGRVDEILFDDKHWTVRYLIVDTGKWLSGRKVLISPMAFGRLNWEANTFDINLTRDQIENSPGVETNEPVSRQWERDYYDYYAWPYYWVGMGGWGPYWYPETLYSRPDSNDIQGLTPAQRADAQTRDHNDAHLRSTKLVTGYGIAATDGNLGHVEDFIVNDETWRICYIAVDTRDWWPGKKVLLPPEWISHVSWPDHNITVDVSREQVWNAPEWEHGQPISRMFEDQLYGYYARQHPWDRQSEGGTHRALQTTPASHTARTTHTAPIAAMPARSGSKGPLEPIDSLATSDVVAVYDTHVEAETAIRELQQMGFDMTRLSIVGKDYHSDEEVVGYYTAGDRMKSWGTTGAIWGGIWSLLFGSAFFFIPGVGPLLVAGPLVGWIVGALESAVVVGGVSALGGALFSIGIPNDRIIAYETQIKAGKFVVIVHDAQSARDRAMIALEASKHTEVEKHVEKDAEKDAVLA